MCLKCYLKRKNVPKAHMFWKNNLDYVHWNVSSGFTPSFLVVVVVLWLGMDGCMDEFFMIFLNDFKEFLQNKSLTVLPPFLLFTFLLVPFHFLSCAFYIVGFSTPRPKIARKYPVHWQLGHISTRSSFSGSPKFHMHLPQFSDPTCLSLFLDPWLSMLPQRPVLSSFQV